MTYQEELSMYEAEYLRHTAFAKGALQEFCHTRDYRAKKILESKGIRIGVKAVIHYKDDNRLFIFKKIKPSAYYCTGPSIHGIIILDSGRLSKARHDEILTLSNDDIANGIQFISRFEG